MSREALCDDQLAKFTDFEEYKDRQAAAVAKKKEVEAQIVRAGRPSTTAALGRMAAQMVTEQEKEKENSKTTTGIVGPTNELATMTGKRQP